jgi:uncharacterized protein (UPF0335 family)
VVRFATELGFDGYPQLQKAMQGLIRSRLTTLQRIEVSRTRMRDDEVLDDVMTYDMSNIRETLEEMPRDVFYDAVDAIVNARRTYIFGAGSCRAIASFAAYYLKLFLPNVQLITVTGQSEIFEEMISISEEDAIIGISFPRYSSRAVRTLHYAASKKAKVIVVSADKDTFSPAVSAFFEKLAGASSVEYYEEFHDDSCVQIISDKAIIYIPLAEIIDFEKEIARLESEKKKLLSEIERIDKKLANEGFVAKAPAAVIEGEKAKRAGYADKLASVEASLAKYQK